jgi:hypothetical protein
MHVTKWLGDIPVEAGCSECASVVLKAIGSSHRPNREEYQKSFQQRGHCKAIHFRESASSSGALLLTADFRTEITDAVYRSPRSRETHATIQRHFKKKR